MLIQNDVKRALGYSTVGQMGYMMMEVGVGAFALAIYHMMAHGIFKATLFLSSGGVIHEARRDPNIPRDEVYDALIKKEEPYKDTPTLFYGAISLLVPLLLVLITHYIFEPDFFKYQAPLILLFFGWITSAQVLLNLFKVGREKPRLTAFLGIVSLFVFLSIYVFMSLLLKGLVFPYEGLQEKVYERAFSNPVLLVLGIAISLILVLVGWILIYFANREEPVKVHLSLYAHLSRELYFPDLYKLIGEGFMKIARILAFTSFSALSVYGIFYTGEPLKNFPLEAFILAFFIPLFPISLITSYLIRRFWIYSYPLVVLLGVISLAFIRIPENEFLYYLASFTLLFHSLRAVLSQSFKEGISELYPALLSLIWLSKEEAHFIFLLLPSALLYLLGIYTKRMLHTDSFYYVGGLMEKIPIYSLLLVMASLQACLTPLMPSFYSFFDTLLKANVIQATLLITGWFLLGAAIALSVWRPLHGLPREDINYTDFMRR